MMLTEKQQIYQHYHQVQFDKYEYLTGEKILPTNQSRMIEEALEKQMKMIGDQGRNQVQTSKFSSPNIQQLSIKYQISGEILSENWNWEI